MNPVRCAIPETTEPGAAARDMAGRKGGHGLMPVKTPAVTGIPAAGSLFKVHGHEEVSLPRRENAIRTIAIPVIAMAMTVAGQHWASSGMGCRGNTGCDTNH